MKLIRVHGPGHYALDDVPMPNAGPRDVVVRIGACGICGSDVHFVKWGMTRADGEPMPLGHEAAGIVETVGTDVAGIEPGMRVFLNPETHDHQWIGNGAAEGAFTDRVLIRNARLGETLLPIPDGISLAQAALVEPLSVGLHGVNRGSPTAETKAVVFGCGPIGLGGVLWLARLGIASVVAVDISDARLDYARKMGAHATINPLTEDLQQRLTELHGAGMPMLGKPTVGTDVFYDMAGGRDVIANIIGMAKYHARLVITAVYPEPVAIDFMDALMRELEITTAGGYPDELHQVLAELPKIDPAILDAYISHHYPFERFDEAFQVAQKPDSAKVMILFD